MSNTEDPDPIDYAEILAQMAVSEAAQLAAQEDVDEHTLLNADPSERVRVSLG